MKKLWQTQWFGIKFEESFEISSKVLPNSSFYNSFYQEFFKKFSGYSDLDKDWLFKKDMVFKWILSHLNKDDSVLSIGPGLGYIEQKLWQERADNNINVHVSDFASDSLKWLKQVIPNENIHEPSEIKNLTNLYFDLIYLSTVDYALDNETFIEILTDYSGKLSNKGRIVIISASLLSVTQFQYAIGKIKDFIKAFLEILGFRSRGQFWGWSRTKDDYLRILKKAGLGSIQHGFIEENNQKIFWISGEMSSTKKVLSKKGDN